MKKWYLPFITGGVIGVVATLLGFSLLTWQFWVIGALGLGCYFMGVYRGGPDGGFYD